MKTYLIIGNCGTGKTWLMKQLARKYNTDIENKLGKIVFLSNEDNIVILGKYDGTTFEGSDKLSMSVSTDFELLEGFLPDDRIILAEGDRFTNSRFLDVFNPTILHIEGSGEEGRLKRGSKQSERHLKSIGTRVNNFKKDYSFKNSTECFDWIVNNIKK